MRTIPLEDVHDRTYVYQRFSGISGFIRTTSDDLQYPFHDPLPLK